MIDKSRVEMSNQRLSEASILTLNRKPVETSAPIFDEVDPVSLGLKISAEILSADLSLKRARACGSKVRTGCITCKTRRVKCDEQKPECLRCRTTGRVCGGYLPMDQGKKIRPIKKGSGLKLEPASLSFDIPGSVRERRSFFFFCARTVPQLSGYFQSDFWSRLLLQTTHLEPAVRHAVVSIGSVHEQYEAGKVVDETQSSGAFALQQYNTAISHLVSTAKKGEKQTADVILMSCLLFISFEMLRANYGVAFTHVQSGLKILSSIRSKGDTAGFSPCQYVELQALESLFLRLDTQATKMGIAPHNVILIGDDHHNQAWGRGPEKMEAFGSLEDARLVLDQYWNFIIHFRRSVIAAIWQPDAQDARKSYYRDKLDQWLTALETYLEQNKLTMEPKREKAVSMLRICHAEAILILGDTGTNHNEGLWDDLSPQFDLIISLTEPLINSPCSDHSNQPSRSFSLELGVISALYITASRYRHPAQRRIAVALLKSSHVQEGITSGFLGWVYTHKILAIEEEGLENLTDCSSIPTHRRIVTKDRLEFFSSERKAKIFYHRPRSEQDPTVEHFEEWINW